MPTKTTRMTTDEQALVRRMHFEQKLSRADIAKALGRTHSTVSRLLAQTKAPGPIGRPKCLSHTAIDRIVKLLEGMVNEADGNYEVTVSMLMRRGRVKVCEKVLADALHERGYWFRDMRQKPILTPDDIADRFTWAKKYRNQPATW